MMISDLKLLRPVGRGTYGEVYLTKKGNIKKQFATKVVHKKILTSYKLKDCLKKEIEIMKEISHKNIVKLYEVLENNDSFFLVMEFCNGGSLSNCLKEYKNKFNKPFSEEIVQYLMKQIVAAIQYFHGKKILHRDIKLDNILITFDSEEDKNNIDMLKSTVKIIDFGFARYLKDWESATTAVGTPAYMDPGILEKYKKIKNKEKNANYSYNEKADIWSLGIICYEMVIGSLPFNSDTITGLVNKEQKGKFFLPTNLSKEIISFINSMLRYELNERLDIKSIYNHVFLNKPYNEFTKINVSQKDKIEFDIKKSIWTIFKEEDIIDKIAIEGGKIAPLEIESIPVYDEDEPIEESVNESNYESDNKIDTKKDNGRNKIDTEYLKAFDCMNDDFIYIEPLLVPFVPGHDPNIISKVTENYKDTF